MTEGANNSNLPQPAELVVSAERHQRLHDIVLYVKALHHCIDPDIYRISLKKLEELEWCVEGVEFESEECHEHLGFTMKVSWEDLWFLETVVRAADTYSHRASTGWRVEGITDQGFDDLLKWLAGSENELFRSKINT